MEYFVLFRLAESKNDEEAKLLMMSDLFGVAKRDIPIERERVGYQRMIRVSILRRSALCRIPFDIEDTVEVLDRFQRIGGEMDGRVVSASKLSLIGIIEAIAR